MSVELMIRILNHGPRGLVGSAGDVDPELWEKGALRGSVEELEKEERRRTDRLPPSRVEKMTLKNVCPNAFIKGGHLEGKLKRVHASFDNNMP